jgi:hypothetical protein
MKLLEDLPDDILRFAGLEGLVVRTERVLLRVAELFDLNSGIFLGIFDILLSSAFSSHCTFLIEYY